MKKILIIAGVFFAFLITSFALQSAGVVAYPNLWTLHVNFAGHPIRVVDALVVSIIASISIMIVLLVFMLFNRTKLERREKLKQKLLVIFQGSILSYLQSWSDHEHYYNEIKSLLISKFRKQLLIDQICDISLNAKGDTSANLKKLFFDLELHKITYRKLHSGHWHKKIQAFKELYALNITDKNQVIYKYINSKNDILRMEAQIALVDLAKETDANPFEFLTNLHHPFSLWEQITLHQIMVQRELNVPDFGQWLFHKNHTVQMFCLRMIREYKQINNQARIKFLTFNEHPAVRKLAYEVIGDLGLKNVMAEVKYNYKDEPQDVKLEMLKSMTKSPDSSLLNFLHNIVDTEQDADLLIEAVKAIHSMEGGDEFLKDMMSKEYKNYNIIIKHVLDHRIN